MLTFLIPVEYYYAVQVVGMKYGDICRPYFENVRSELVLGHAYTIPGSWCMKQLVSIVSMSKVRLDHASLQ